MTDCFETRPFASAAMVICALSAIHCGDDDDSNSVTCGAGTVLSNGTCVPASGGAAGSSNNGGAGGGAANGGTGGSALAGASGGGQSGSAGQSGSGGSSAGGTGAVSIGDDDPCPEPASALVAQCASTHGVCPGVATSDCWTKCDPNRPVGDAVHIPSPPFEVAFRVGIDADPALCETCDCDVECGLHVRNSLSFYFDASDAFTWLRVEVDAPWTVSAVSGEACEPRMNCYEFQVWASGVLYLHSEESPAPARNVWIRSIAENELGGCP